MNYKAVTGTHRCFIYTEHIRALSGEEVSIMTPSKIKI